MKDVGRSDPFKPSKKVASNHAVDQATLACRAIMEQEALAREKKTARLRQLRLERDAAEAELGERPAAAGRPRTKKPSPKTDARR
ncbi:hypothetical protein [Sinorhizobium sp. CCBAU 05631]|uniref:hypothetical protein n=1 Tax=Sinorhizobium sp. CCBAU 05631 TaxID=794846 RepID=UPI0005677B88